mmetsp:Transcript_77712/g.251501  ORF Transcript_77712/g.251501 Transcript_77712/m.251501 type:complete len:84 (-) Transcript_77712:1053-1304(-)
MDRGTSASARAATQRADYDGCPGSHQEACAGCCPGGALQRPCTWGGDIFGTSNANAVPGAAPIASEVSKGCDAGSAACKFAAG